MSMDQVITHLNRRYNLTEYQVSAGDPRVADWPFMRSPESVVLLTGIYLLVVKYGPSYMANRQPVRATGLMVSYNFFMVGLSLYMFFEFFACGYNGRFDFLCQPCDYSRTPQGYREASVAWWYFFSKIIEFLDTIFAIIRKKNGQLTFLHVYHHSTMALICWYVAKYVPGGEKFYAGGFNVLVHVFMYTYYALAAMGPQVQKYLWWKRYLTKFQMIQFVSVNTRSLLSLFVECRYPAWINVVAIFYSSSLLALFANFYRQSYIEAKSKKESEKLKSSSPVNEAARHVIHGRQHTD
ncbi:very long chain fatty acid elongase 4-like [Littorina saxatilis]|uniref:Elongation of very long chain fatty acids protein n=1 Tax=Littorina saxatilis TaxID=31220 RepID=A0AAN9G8L5_9CAEN